MRWSFRGLLVGAIAVLAIDLYEMVDRNGGIWPSGTGATEAVTAPVLPPAVETGSSGLPSADPREHLTTDDGLLRGQIRFELLPGGILLAEGSIEQGAAARFRAEVEARGEYVSTVRLNSPGGSLEDAMAMARLVREREYRTEVLDGALCASSCPLVFAGGVTRAAGEKAAIGLHQFYAPSGSSTAPAQAMSDAQITTARISRHLGDMGVDAAVWLHALDTPPRQLYYLTREEMARYRLVTSAPSIASR
ncbi:hypothetical protein [Chelativorans sp. ZYF759]|uniref:COG3904 family protein n=1 Tax=Chelativorans sp. ZYF759 TaxID=2692213 RepID=UPI00145EC89A|nr:hypothetical protein [Chelativorans sp. ZYF759]